MVVRQSIADFTNSWCDNIASAALCSVHSTNSRCCLWSYFFHSCINWILYVCRDQSSCKVRCTDSSEIFNGWFLYGISVSGLLSTLWGTAAILATKRLERWHAFVTICRSRYMKYFLTLCFSCFTVYRQKRPQKAISCSSLLLDIFDAFYFFIWLLVHLKCFIFWSNSPLSIFFFYTYFTIFS